MEDRRAKLKEIKMKSSCKACGRKGHWAGDRECPGKPPAGHRAVSQVAHLAGEIRTFEKAVQTDDPMGRPRVKQAQAVESLGTPTKGLRTMSTCLTKMKDMPSWASLTRRT